MQSLRIWTDRSTQWKTEQNVWGSTQHEVKSSQKIKKEKKETKNPNQRNELENEDWRYNIIKGARTAPI